MQVHSGVHALLIHFVELHLLHTAFTKIWCAFSYVLHFDDRVHSRDRAFFSITYHYTNIDIDLHFRYMRTCMHFSVHTACVC